jgi:hypothetical protein
MRREPVYDYALLVLSLILLAVIWTPGCEFDTSPIDPGRGEGAAGSVAVNDSDAVVRVFKAALTTKDGIWRVQNRKWNGSSGNYEARNDLNACLSMILRPEWNDGHFYQCGTSGGGSYCEDSQGVRYLATNCQPIISGQAFPRVCTIMYSFATLGTCTWTTNSADPWYSDASLFNGTRVYAGSPTRTSRWTVTR